jgi:hypothetical protein
MRLSLSLTASLALLITTPANADLITNGSFQTGDLTGWTGSSTVFGPFLVRPDDVTGKGIQNAAEALTGASADLRQVVQIDTPGFYQFSADTAVTMNYPPKDHGSGISSSASLLIDGLAVTPPSGFYDLDGPSGSIYRRHLSSPFLALGAGSHTVEFLFAFDANVFDTANIDATNFALSPFAGVPEPGPLTLATIGLGMLGLVTFGRRRRAVRLAFTPGRTA